MNTLINLNLLDTARAPIPAALQWLAAYDGAEGDVIKLSQAAPGLAPGSPLRMALAMAGRSDEAARYGDIFGDEAFRASFAEATNRLYGAALTGGDIAITPGCNQAFVSVLMALAKAGDNIILPSPWYFNHEMAARMLASKSSRSSAIPRSASCRSLLRRPS